ncbi:MAG: hypothetical protein U0822_04810 [Anaerolineae bacterium]
MLLPKDRDLGFVTTLRGGTLTDSRHHLLALWAAACAEHVLDLFEWAQPEGPRLRLAIEQTSTLEQRSIVKVKDYQGAWIGIHC